MAALARAAGVFGSLVVLTTVGAEPPAVDQVRGLRVRLAKVIKEDQLPEKFREEAQHVDDDAEAALQAVVAFYGEGSASVLQGVLDEYSTFTADLTKTKMNIEKRIQITKVHSNGGRAAELEAEMESKVRQLFAGLQAVKDVTGEQEKSRGRVVVQVEKSLVATDDVMAHLSALKGSMMAMRDWWKAKLAIGTQVQEVKDLYVMLKQRKALPIKAQLALLKRDQFKNSAYAQRLLRSHSEKLALYSQLEAILPGDVLESVLPKQQAAGHLEAAGSNGRVHVVSSRMKNDVREGIEGLSGVQKMLRTLLAGTELTSVERGQAETILSALSEALDKASKTKDLKSQLDILDDVENKVTEWKKAFGV